jgi:hypothetical protein
MDSVMKKTITFLVFFSIPIILHAGDTMPVLDDSLLCRNKWKMSEYPGWGHMTFNTDGTFRTDIPNTGDHCMGTYTVSDGVLTMNIQSTFGIGILSEGVKSGTIKLSIKDIGSPFHPFALVRMDDSTERAVLWPEEILSSAGKKGTYGGTEVITIQEPGFINTNSVFLRNGPSQNAMPLFYRKDPPFETDEPYDVRSEKFLPSGQRLRIICRTVVKNRIGKWNNYWYLVTIIADKGDPLSLYSFSETDDLRNGYYYLNRPVWIYGQFITRGK